MTDWIDRYDDPAASWWCAYDDGAVWPCEPLTGCYFFTTVRALAPAPNAGETMSVDPQRVYDSQFHRWSAR